MRYGARCWMVIVPVAVASITWAMFTLPVVDIGTTLRGWLALELNMAARAADEASATPTAELKLPDDQWPLFRGDTLARGVSASKLPSKPELLWQRSYKDKNEAFEATPVIVGGVVYLGGLNGPLYALDLATGKEQWQFKTEGGFHAAAAVRDKLLYIGDNDGKFYCLDAKTGEQKWTFTTQAEIDNGANFYKDRVIFGSQDATLYCLDAAGKQVWKHTIGDQIRCFPTIVANRAFVAGCDGTLHIIDLDTGKSTGGVPIDNPTGCTPAVLGDMAYVGTEGDKFFAINWRKPAVEWTYEHPERKLSYRSSAAATKDVLVVGNRGKFVVGLDPANGKALWTFNTPAAVEGSAVIVGERAFFGTARGRLYALDIKTGKPTWEYAAGGGFQSSPAVASGRLVIGSEDGIVYCFGAKEK
jgi:outer membrane protein assembly factor BamB